ncbi:MAG: U32 family peptidase [Treponema sp.]|nr:U32 family peptidase [Treponema sp.]
MTELLAPAGNPEALDAAIGEGADAVYLGLKSFNARLRSSNFAWNQFEGAVQSLHRMGKKIYVTVNTVCEEHETERLYRFLNYLNRIKPDGLIVQDFGVVRMCQEFAPDLELHASTQMNVESAAAANLLCREGIKRVVVARELGLEEIKSIKQNTNAEIEMFVHGALCVSESGLCLFSSYLGGKSANRGMCTQACRRFYTADLPGTTGTGYYFSPCDLQLIDHIPDLMEAGVDSFKIEGRMKSAEYVGAVTAAYRFVMDHWKEDRKGAIAEGKRILSTDFARSKTDYWYGFKDVNEGISQGGEKILNPSQAGGTGIYLGKIASLRESTEEERKLSLEGRPEFKSEEERKAAFIQMAVLKGGTYIPDPGDSIRLHRKDDSERESHKVRVVKQDAKGDTWIDVPLGFTVGDSVYLLQTKSMSKRYKRVLPVDLSKCRRQPGPERLPILDLTELKKNELSWFPEGLYVEVSTASDAHAVQILHPVRLIMEINNESLNDLLKKDTPEKPLLPFSKKMTILALDPFVPEGTAALLKENLDVLIQKGYTTFIVNNLAHINMLKTKKDVHMIAGPYLYTFNKWAVSFLENQNIMALQTPIENSERNLEETFASKAERSRVLVSVFGYPVLFRMRFKLPKDYDFTFFRDKESTSFKVNSTPDGSFVMPELPFSITDKMETLKNKGWTRQLIDFSKTSVSKAELRTMVNLLRNKTVIPETSRFNWKDGFYNPEKMEAYQAIAAKNEERKASGKKPPVRKKK